MIAGHLQTDGYVTIRTNNIAYLAHRLAWLLYYGIWPTDIIDHKNGIKSDNKISNIRLGTQSKNMVNTGLYSHNTSGHKGVTWSKKDNRWRATISIDGKLKQLGQFINKEDAIECRNKACIEKYGEFYRLN